LAPHVKIIDPAKEVARTADEALQMMGWRSWGKREGSFSFYESGEGPKQIKEFAEKVFNSKIGAINLCKNVAYRWKRTFLTSLVCKIISSISSKT